MSVCTFHATPRCRALLFPLLSCAEQRPALQHGAEKRPGTFDFHSRWNMTLWFAVLTFKRREAKRRGVSIRAAKWRSALEGGRMKVGKGSDAGLGEMKEEEDGERGWMSMQAARPSVCFSDFPLIELGLLDVQYSAFRLTLELIFLSLLCLPCECIYACLCTCVLSCSLWPAKVNLTVVCFLFWHALCGSLRGAVCELGGGMTCLAGLMVSETHINTRTGEVIH